MTTIPVTDDISIEILGPDDIEGPLAVTVVARHPASTYKLTVRAGEIKPLVTALSEAGGELAELWRGVDHALAWPTKHCKNLSSLGCVDEKQAGGSSRETEAFSKKAK